MYDVRLLQVLREIALRGSFSAAAEALNYTQPAVSQQIARLERQTGVTLVDRTSRGIRLTAAGQVLLRRTERVLAELQAAEDELGELAAEARGRLRVAAFSTAAGTIVPEAVALFREQRPAVEVELHLLDPPVSLPMLQRGELEVALTEIRGFSQEVSLDGLTVQHLFDDPLHVSLPGGHPLATRDSVRARRPVRRGLDPAHAGRLVPRHQHRPAGVPGGGLRAARRLLLHGLLRDPGPRGHAAWGSRSSRRSRW